MFQDIELTNELGLEYIGLTVSKANAVSHCSLWLEHRTNSSVYLQAILVLQRVNVIELK